MGSQCYLPPGRGDIPALTPAEAGTRFSDPGVEAELTCKAEGPRFLGPIRLSHPNRICRGVVWDIRLQCFRLSALTLLVGRQEGHLACKKMSGGVLVWLSVWSEVQTCIWPS